MGKILLVFPGLSSPPLPKLNMAPGAGAGLPGTLTGAPPNAKEGAGLAAPPNKDAGVPFAGAGAAAPKLKLGVPPGAPNAKGEGAEGVPGRESCCCCCCRGRGVKEKPLLCPGAGEATGETAPKGDVAPDWSPPSPVEDEAPNPPPPPPPKRPPLAEGWEGAPNAAKGEGDVDPEAVGAAPNNEGALPFAEGAAGFPKTNDDDAVVEGVIELAPKGFGFGVAAAPPKRPFVLAVAPPPKRDELDVPAESGAPNDDPNEGVLAPKRVFVVVEGATTPKGEGAGTAAAEVGGSGPSSSIPLSSPSASVSAIEGAAPNPAKVDGATAGGGATVAGVKEKEGVVEMAAPAEAGVVPKLKADGAAAGTVVVGTVVVEPKENGVAANVVFCTENQKGARSAIVLKMEAPKKKKRQSDPLTSAAPPLVLLPNKFPAPAPKLADFPSLAPAPLSCTIWAIGFPNAANGFV